MEWTRKKRIIVAIPIIIGTSFLAIALILGVPATFTDPVLEFPIQETSYIDNLRPYGVPDWSGPGTHHNGIDLVINKSVTIVSPTSGTVLFISENKNPNSENYNILFSIDIQINWGWKLSLVLEPNYNGDNETMNTHQRESIKVALLQRINVGDEVATLLYDNSGSHLHYMLSNTFGGDVCAYTYSSHTAKAIFDQIDINQGTQICIPLL